MARPSMRTVLNKILTEGTLTSKYTHNKFNITIPVILPLVKMWHV